MAAVQIKAHRRVAAPCKACCQVGYDWAVLRNFGPIIQAWPTASMLKWNTSNQQRCVQCQPCRRCRKSLCCTPASNSAQAAYQQPWHEVRPQRQHGKHQNMLSWRRGIHTLGKQSEAAMIGFAAYLRFAERERCIHLAISAKCQFMCATLTPGQHREPQLSLNTPCC